MKKSLAVQAALVAAVLLAAGFAAAEAADAPAPTLEQLFAADEGGGCQLPDFTGMSDQEIAEAALDAGFRIDDSVQAQPPLCPSTFLCTSIANCAAGPNCTVNDIGACCLRGGTVFCCGVGSIKVRTCPCVCTGLACSFQCVASNDVTARCV